MQVFWAYFSLLQEQEMAQSLTARLLPYMLHYCSQGCGCYQGNPSRGKSFFCQDKMIRERKNLVRVKVIVPKKQPTLACFCKLGILWHIDRNTSNPFMTTMICSCVETGGMPVFFFCLFFALLCNKFHSTVLWNKRKKNKEK